MEILILSLVAWGMCGVIFTIISFIAFDILLKKIYNNAHDVWKSLNEPCGFFWIPKECKAHIVKHALSRNLCGDRLRNDTIINTMPEQVDCRLIYLLKVYRALCRFRAIAFVIFALHFIVIAILALI